MKVRLTQKDLLLGVYRARPGSLNPGLSIWWNGRYIWPRQRKISKRFPKTALLFEMKETDDAVGSLHQEP
jgi:hypothetical protein